MRRLLLSLLLPLATALTPPAAAHHPDYAEPLINELRRQGIRVYPNQSSCGGGSNVAGTYNAYTKVLCLVSPKIVGTQWYAVLVHESMHVVQDKLDGYDNSSYASVLETYERYNGRAARNELIRNWKARVSASHAHNARDYARKQLSQPGLRGGSGNPSHHRYIIEWEAEMAEHFPDIVLDMLRK